MPRPCSTGLRPVLAGMLVAISGACTVFTDLDDLQGGGGATTTASGGSAGNGGTGGGGAGAQGGGGGVGPCELGSILRKARTTFSTELGSFEAVETLTLPGGSAPDGWLLLISARLRSTSVGPSGAELRYVVDGVERGRGECLVESTDASDGGPFNSFDHVPASDADRDVTVELRSKSSHIATVDDLRMVAVPWPAGSEVMLSETPGETLFTQTDPVVRAYFDVESITLRPSAPGRYLVMGDVSASEGPGVASVGARIFAPGPEYWPGVGAFTTRPHLSFPQPFPQSLFIARVFESDGTTADFRLQVDPSGTEGSTLYHSRLIAFRLDAFADSPHAERNPETPLGGTEFESAIALDVGGSRCREYAVIGNVALHGDGAAHHVDFVAGRTTTSFRQNYQSTESKLAFSNFDAFATTEPIHHEVFVKKGLDTDAMYARDALIVALGR